MLRIERFEHSGELADVRITDNAVKLATEIGTNGEVLYSAAREYSCFRFVYSTVTPAFGRIEISAE